MRSCRFLFARAGALAVLLSMASGHMLYAQTGGRSALETAPTHWDETRAWRAEGNAIIDSRDGRIQSVSQLFEGPYTGKPEDAARAFLNAHKDWVGLDPSDANLRVVRSVESPGGYHVTFERYVGDVPVYPGNLVVSFDRDMYVRFYFSSLYLFSEQVPTIASRNASDAEQIAETHLKPTDTKPVYGPNADLVIWAGDNRDPALCWRVRVNYIDPYGDWEVLVDANSGQIRRVRDLAVAVNGTGNVFDPDPTTTAGQPYGSPGLSDNNDADSPQLDAQLFNRTLLDIGVVNIFGINWYFLTGPYCDIDDIESPNVAPVFQAASTVFNFTRNVSAFEDVMTYYNIDTSQRWMRTLGFLNIQNLSLPCDPHAEGNGCNAHYHSNGNYLSFADCPTAVNAAEDAEVIWHEYGHAINNSISPGFGGGDEDAIGEGWGDYWAASYSRAIAAYQANEWVGWGFHPLFSGRSLQQGLHYPEDAGNPDPHWSGMIWSQALYEAEININSRSIMNRVTLQSYYYYGNGSSMLTAANAVLTADQNLYGGTHQAGITTSFVARGLVTAPNNDQCPGFIIYDQPYVSSGSTANAAHDYNNCANNLSQDVMYTLAAKSCPRNVVVSLCGSSYDTYISVASGTYCPGDTWVVCNDDFCGLQSQVSFTAAASTTYYIYIHGYATHSGAFTISVTWADSDPIPPNDACNGALAINSLPYSHNSTTCGANNNYLNCIGPSSAETVYSLTLGTCQSVTVSLCGSSFDTGLEVRWGGACPGSQTVACNDDWCGLSSQVTFNATANETYYIFVDGYCTTCEGAYTLNVTSNGAFVAPNDQCPGTTIASLPYQDTGSTRCANNNFTNCIGQTSSDVVYQYTSPICQNVTVSLCGSNYDSAIEVRSGGACPGVARVNCNDDFCGLQSQTSFFAETGVTYYFIIHGFSAANGVYVLNVTGTPGGVRPNDTCPGASAITSLPYLTVGSTACANNDRINCVGTTSREVFYSLLLESCMQVTATLCGSGYDTAIEIRSGGDVCPGNIQVACNDDNYCGNDFVLQSTVQFNVSSNRLYWIIVHGFSTYSGPYILNVTGTTCPPDSLVVQRQGNNAYLDWAPVSSSGTVTYRVYRTTTPDVQPIPGNLLATTTNAFYSDLNVVGDPQIKYFYAVTAEGPALLLENEGETPLASVEPEKIITPEEQAMMVATTPGYLDPLWIGGPNPDKPAAETLEQNQYGAWYGILAPLPESRQLKQ